METQKISELVDEHLSGTGKFLVELLVKPVNRVFIFIDGDQGVTIEDCVSLSRFLESRFDREKEDFELNVSSAGADQPIRLPRQYPKNIGRSLLVKLTEEEEEVKGKLTEAGEEGITLEITGKKKKEPVESRYISFDRIREAKVIISFK